MATDPKAAQRSQRAYIKRKHLAEAAMAGATVLDVTLAARAADGHYVIRLYDGTDLHLDLRSPVGSIQEDVATVKSSKKVYAPKSWAPEYWNKVAGRLRAGEYSRVEALDIIQESDKLDDKQKRQAVAVIEAMPDSPDWYEHVPLAES